MRRVALTPIVLAIALAGCPTLDPEIVGFEGDIVFLTPANQDVFEELDRLELTFYYSGLEPKNYVLTSPFGTHPLEDLPRAEAGEVRLEVLGKQQDASAADGWRLAAAGEAGGFSMPPDGEIEVFLALKGQIAELPGGLSAARSDGTATLMPDGRVLVVGGVDEDGPVARMETLLDDPDAWLTSAGVQGVDRGDHARVAHVALMVEDTGSDFDGKVTLLGGDSGCQDFYCFPVYDAVYDVLTYDPADDSTEVAAQLNGASVGPRAAWANDDRIALIGGFDDQEGYITQPLLFDPANLDSYAAPQTGESHEQHTATQLGGPGSNVLIVAGMGAGVGGVRVQSLAEVYTPGTNIFDTGELAEARYRHTATLLGDGQVLVLGGASGNSWDSPGDALSSAELYDPDQGDFFEVQQTLAYPRQRHVAVRLEGDGDRVLICGGVDELDGSPTSYCELYDHEEQTITVLDGPAMAPGGEGMMAVPLDDGRVLFLGGQAGGEARSEVYMYVP
jgi:hypothetical protein